MMYGWSTTIRDNRSTDRQQSIVDIDFKKRRLLSNQLYLPNSSNNKIEWYTHTTICHGPKSMRKKFMSFFLDHYHSIKYLKETKVLIEKKSNFNQSKINLMKIKNKNIFWQVLFENFFATNKRIKILFKTTKRQIE